MDLYASCVLIRAISILSRILEVSVKKQISAKKQKVEKLCREIQTYCKCSAWLRLGWLTLTQLDSSWHSLTQLNSAQLSSTQLNSALLSLTQLDSAWLISTQLGSDRVIPSTRKKFNTYYSISWIVLPYLRFTILDASQLDWWKNCSPGGATCTRSM